MMNDLDVLILRATQGGLIAGHGAQKLFGWFEGPGLEGTKGFMEALGLKPGDLWALGAALAEFGGGTLTALGLMSPLGPIGVMSSMAMATGTAHRDKPIWVTAGGAELPLTNIAAALALALSGPGKFSLDRALGIKVPGPLVAASAFVAAALVTYGLANQGATSQRQRQDAGAEAQSGHTS